MKWFNAFFSFLKSGIIGFGGGNAFIPVVEKEIVQNKKYITADEYTGHTVIASITPGAFPVKLGALWNEKYSVISAYAISLPCIFILIILSFLSNASNSVITYIEFMSVGISAYVIFIFYIYIQKTATAFNYKINILIMTVSFILVGEKSIYKFFGFPKMTPVFNLGIIHLIIITIFVICFQGKSKSLLRAAISIIISCLFIFLNSDLFTISPIFNILTIFIMIFLSIISVVQDKEKDHGGKIMINKRIIVNICWFLLICVIPCIVILIINPSFVSYLIKCALSTGSGFGGSGAYIPITESFFVDTGLIDRQIFYTQIVPISNALPGPLVIKIIMGIGFFVGNASGGLAIGWLLAIAGFCVTIAVSSIPAIVVLMFFDSLGNSYRLEKVKRYTLPVICGILISTILSMLYESINIMKNKTDIPFPAGLGFMMVLFSGLLLLRKKYKINDIFLIAASGIFSLISLILFS